MNCLEEGSNEVVRFIKITLMEERKNETTQ